MMKTIASVSKRLLPSLAFTFELFGFCSPATASETNQVVATRGCGLASLDWIVLGAYALGMLLIGVYYSWANRSSDDYLLGGRTMKPWMVGLSMFATFVSVLTYLSVPGEMINHGPMILAQILPMPLIVLVVCWLFIPFIMRFRVTSGYEILQARFGESVRLLAAAIFLVVRFLWMGLMIYATVNKVLVPILGLDVAWSPYICTVLGLITVVYSSMGGLRAVVLTDVIQAIILFLGAVAAIVLITINLGGVSGWWPTQWQTHWDSLTWWFSSDPDSRRLSTAAVVTSTTFWWIATAGSDQMAFQRYLSTRDVKSARRMFTISLSASALLTGILGLLGFALLSYFQEHPEMMAPGQSIMGSADELLPQYIVVGLPPGFSGLLIAALVAATMSSLSAGVNSASLVIVTDLIGRLRKSTFSEDVRLRTAKRASWIVGILAILLSLAVGSIEGNLLELCYKIGNLFIVPLFMLFFMAMFVPWGTTLGAWAAALASAMVAIGIGYFKWFGLGFLWITIGPLIVGIVVGPLASLLPLGKVPGSRIEDLLRDSDLSEGDRD